MGECDMVKSQVINSSEIVFILSCPGQKEQKNGRPASGKTGDNLEYLLSKLVSLGFFKNGTAKNNVTIINSSENVYSGKDNSEPKSDEVLEDGNINRIIKQLSGVESIKYIFCCGDVASLLLSMLFFKYHKSDVKIYRIKHLSARGIMHYKKNVVMTTTERLDELAKDINKMKTSSNIIIHLNT